MKKYIFLTIIGKADPSESCEIMARTFKYVVGVGGHPHIYLIFFICVCPLYRLTPIQ